MNQVHPAFLFLAEAESHTNGEVHGIARRSVNTTERGCVWRHARLEIRPLRDVRRQQRSRSLEYDALHRFAILGRKDELREF